MSCCQRLKRYNKMGLVCVDGVAVLFFLPLRSPHPPRSGFQAQKFHSDSGARSNQNSCVILNCVREYVQLHESGLDRFAVTNLLIKMTERLNMTRESSRQSPLFPLIFIK
jgi:hypothetical protein